MMAALMMFGLSPADIYLFVGKVVVWVFLIVIGISIILSTIYGSIRVWKGVWVRLSNRMWDGYSHDPDEGNGRPPLWRMRISGVSLAIAQGKFWKIPSVYAEAETLTDDDTTLRDHLKSVLSTGS